MGNLKGELNEIVREIREQTIKKDGNINKEEQVLSENYDDLFDSLNEEEKESRLKKDE